MKRLKAAAVRRAFREVAGRDLCPACRSRILPGQKAEWIGSRRYHSRCARFRRSG